jgi:hypothetical protein
MRDGRIDDACSIEQSAQDYSLAACDCKEAELDATVERPAADVATEFMRETKAARSEEERIAVRRRLRRDGKLGYQRWQLGNQAGISELRLSDAKGHPRLRLRVTADGAARVDFLDAAGTVVNSLTP